MLEQQKINIYQQPKNQPQQNPNSQLMTNTNNTSCLDFTNLFTRLKNGENYHPQQFMTRTSIKTRERPKSVFIARERLVTEDNRSTMRHSSYNRKWFNTTKDVGFKIKLFTEQSSPSLKYLKTERNSLRYLALNNFCLKKISMPNKNTENIEIQTESSTKLKIKSLKISVQENPQTNYKKKTLRTYKKNKKVISVLKPSDILDRVQGRKLF